MNVRRRLAVYPIATIAALFGLCGAARADILAGGPAYGGPASIGGTVTCRLFNPGAFSVSVSTRQIWDNVGNPVALASDTCNVSMAVGKTCAYSAPIGGNLAYSCRAIVQGIEPKVSGVTEIQAPSHAVLAIVPLAK